jgi:hypothetical protein
VPWGVGRRANPERITLRERWPTAPAAGFELFGAFNTALWPVLVAA